jgi:hypothetical protein
VTTLTNSTTTINLPTDLLWVDEFAWQPVQYVSRYSVGGALLVNSGKRLTGRPITLAGGADWAWIKRSVVLALQTLSEIESPQMTLVYRGVSYAVTWAPDGAPLAAEPIVDYANPGSTDNYAVTLRFITRA